MSANRRSSHRDRSYMCPNPPLLIKREHKRCSFRLNICWIYILWDEGVGSVDDGSAVYRLARTERAALLLFI